MATLSSDAEAGPSEPEVELDAQLLAQLTTTATKHRDIAFGRRGCVSGRRLVAMMRACRSTNTFRITVTSSCLVLRYTTSLSRGRLLLKLHSIAPNAFVVPLRADHPRRASHARS